MSVDQLTDRARCSRLTADVALTACVILCDGSQCFVLFFGGFYEKKWD